MNNIEGFLQGTGINDERNTCEAFLNTKSKKSKIGLKGKAFKRNAMVNTNHNKIFGRWKK